MTATLPHISPPGSRHGGRDPADHNPHVASGRFGQGSPMVTNGVSIGLGTVGLGERCQSERERARREHYKQWKREKAYTSPVRSAAQVEEANKKSPRSSKERYQEKKAKKNEILEKRQLNDEKRILKSREESARWKERLRESKQEEKEFTATFTQLCREQVHAGSFGHTHNNSNSPHRSTAGGAYTVKQLKADAAAAAALAESSDQPPFAAPATVTDGSALSPAPPSTAAPGHSPHRHSQYHHKQSSPAPVYAIQTGGASYQSTTAGNSPLTPRQQSVKEEVEMQQRINESVRNVDDDLRQQRIQQIHPIIAAQLQHTQEAREIAVEHKRDEVQAIRETVQEYIKLKHQQDEDREKDYSVIAKEQRSGMMQRVEEEKEKILEWKTREADKQREMRPARHERTSLSQEALKSSHPGTSSSQQSPRSRATTAESAQVLEGRAAAAAVVRQQREQLKSARDADRQAEKERNVKLYQEARQARLEAKSQRAAAKEATSTNHSPSHAAGAPPTTTDSD